MPATVTPRVRNLIVCDRIRASTAEDGVFHLRGARCWLTLDDLSTRRRLHLFVILSSPRAGRFPGYVRVIDSQTDRTVFYGQIEPTPEFPEHADLLPLDLPISVRFPRSGIFSIEIWFFQETSPDVQKMEQPFYVLQREQ
jgi:hypothetical protein